MKILFAKNLSLLFILFTVILIAAIPVIRFDMVYFEQPTLYSANQMITSLKDLIHIYLHPKLLHAAIPFFRPSGHFLMYQIITPILGWHHTKGFIMVNLFFLALSGFFSIKLYEVLFPGYKTGGYVALGLYIMHPALHLSRASVMHFEFAYVCFTLLSLYLFAVFCKKNLAHKKGTLPDFNFIHLPILAWSLFFYAFAITFKESAVMLGPVLIAYLYIACYDRQPLMRFFRSLLDNAQVRQITLLLATLTLFFAIYLTLPWNVALHHPSRSINFANMSGAFNHFFKLLTGFNIDLVPSPFSALPSPSMTWRRIVFPALMSYVLWPLLAAVILSTLLILRRHSPDATEYKKSLLFLWLASGLFLVLPLMWGMGLPWHLSLTLLCQSLVMGFSMEYLCRLFIKTTFRAHLICIMTALTLALLTIPVDQANIHAYQQLRYSSNFENVLFELTVNRNAVFSPPDIRGQLRPDSVIIVEDNILKDDYTLGNSMYPFFISFNRPNFETLHHSQPFFFAKFHVNYSGNLFKWAYLMPTLREEIFPFSVAHMDDVRNEMIYSWLRNANNIFCVGYDRDGHWHDLTSAFRKNLFIEKKRRQLKVTPYRVLPDALFEGTPYDTKLYPYHDIQLCQYKCDQDAGCKGFINIYSDFKNHIISACTFYEKIALKRKTCSICTGYVKNFLS